MTSSGAEVRRWFSRPGRPTGLVLFAAAALLAVLTAIALIDLFTAPLPPVQYGPFGDPQTLTGAMVLIALFMGLGIRAVRGLSPKALSRTLLILIAAGPVGWTLAALDTVGPDMSNSAGSTGAFIAMFLLVVAPLVTVVAVVAALAEIIRSSPDTPRITT